LTLTPSDLKELVTSIDKLTMKVDTVGSRLVTLDYTLWGIWIGSTIMIIMALKEWGLWG